MVKITPRNTDKFLKAFDTYMSGSRRDRKKVMEIQARGILKTLLSVTPPSGWNSSANEGEGEMIKGDDARKQGEAAVESDIRKLFQVRKKRPKNPCDIPSVHKRFRSSSDGRVHIKLNRGVIDKRYHVLASDLNAYIALKKKQVGILTAGWVEAGKSIGGIKAPKWISKHSAKGSGKITVSSSRITFKASNDVPYAGQVADFQRRITYALDAQAGKLERQIENYEKRRMKKSGLPVK